MKDIATFALVEGIFEDSSIPPYPNTLNYNKHRITLQYLSIITFIKRKEKKNNPKLQLSLTYPPFIQKTSTIHHQSK
jgi:hypothetical protein